MTITPATISCAHPAQLSALIDRLYDDHDSLVAFRSGIGNRGTTPAPVTDGRPL